MSTVLSFFSSLIILFLSFHPMTSINDLIQETCKKCSETDPNTSQKFCVDSLKADPRSHSARNLTELGLISMKLTRRNVTDTRVHIEELLKEEKKKKKKKRFTDPFVEECLEDCLEVYSDAIPTLREAIRDYRAQRYADSDIKVSSVLDAPSTCEDGFKEKRGVVSPLTTRNNNTFQLSAIALSIVNLLSE